MSGWTPEQEALRASARTFVAREVVPHLAQWEREGLVPRELHRTAGRHGFLGVGFAEAVGGSGGDLRDVVALTEAFIDAGASSGLMAALFTHGIALPHIVAAGSPELIDRYVRPTLAGELIGSLAVTEPSGGSDVARLRTRAVRDGDHYVVTGSKTFITSGTRADFLTTAVRTGGPGSSGLSLIVIDTDSPGLTRSAPLAKTGWRCSDTAELSYDAVRVPAGNLVGTQNAGFELIAQHFVTERLVLAVHAYSIAARCLELTVEQVRGRETFGRPVITRQAVRHRLVDMARRTDAARTYTRDVVHMVAAGAGGGKGSGTGDGTGAVARALMAKATAVEACLFVADAAVQLHGGMGFMTGVEVERHARDARVLGIGGGTSEVLADLTARLLGYTA